MLLSSERRVHGSGRTCTPARSVEMTPCAFLCNVPNCGAGALYHPMPVSALRAASPCGGSQYRYHNNPCMPTVTPAASLMAFLPLLPLMSARSCPARPAPTACCQLPAAARRWSWPAGSGRREAAWTCAELLICMHGSQSTYGLSGGPHGWPETT